jgi:hypothetical protein
MISGSTLPNDLNHIFHAEQPLRLMRVKGNLRIGVPRRTKEIPNQQL